MSTFFHMFKPKVVHGTREKMAELTPDLYQELLKYKIHDNNYFRQPIDLSNYRGRTEGREAA